MRFAMGSKIAKWSGLCLLSFFSLSVTSWALTVTTVGEGPTRQAAINGAWRAAVEEGLGSMVQSKTRVAEGKLDFDRIISASSGYVRGYSPLAEGKDPIDGTYKVKLQVELDDYKLKDLLKEFREDPRFQKAFQKATFDQRRVVVLYGKRTSASLHYDAMAVQEIIDLVEDKLTGYGFRVFLPEHIERIKKRSTDLSLDEKTAVQIARQESGDAVVLLDVAAGKRPTSDGFWLVHTTLGLKAFDVTTGELFANVRKREKALSRGGDYGIEEGAARAVEKAGGQATDDLVAKIVGRFSTKRDKFLTFIFKDVSEATQDRLYGILEDLGWEFRVARQYGTQMEVEVFTELDPTSANMSFKRAIKKSGFGLKQLELKGARILYSGKSTL
jgi:hypothetical protein